MIEAAQPIPVARDEDDRGQYAAAIHNLAAPIRDLALPAQQLAGTTWADDIARIRGELALLVLEVQADVAESQRQAEEEARTISREAARVARREARRGGYVFLEPEDELEQDSVVSSEQIP